MPAPAPALAHQLRKLTKRAVAAWGRPAQGASMRALLEVYSTLVRLSPPTLDVLLPPLLVHNATTVVPGNKQVWAEPPERVRAVV